MNLPKMLYLLNSVRLPYSLKIGKLRSVDLVWTSSLYVAIHIRFHKSVFFWHLAHHKLSQNSDENNPFKPNQVAPSIHIMIELRYSSLDQWNKDTCFERNV